MSLFSFGINRTIQVSKLPLGISTSNRYLSGWKGSTFLTAAVKEAFSVVEVTWVRAGLRKWSISGLNKAAAPVILRNTMTTPV